VGAAVEAAVGERDQAEVVEADRAPLVPGDARHLPLHRGRDRPDAGVEGGRERRGDGEDHETH